MTWKVGDRVQDVIGFTGTVTAQEDDEIEVTWDISGCCSDLGATDIVAMVEGQDDPAKQQQFYAEVFGADEAAA